MHLNDLYNPKNVYEGFFETYFIRPFFHHYSDFKGKESVKSCVLSFLAWLVITLGIAGIMMGQVGIIGPESGLLATYWICGIWILASIVPLCALIARTLHGAPDHEHKFRMLGIDTLLGVSCLLFFVLGLLMMITTLDSGELNPNARMYDEPDTTVEDVYVREEPIFTYQDETPASVPEIDTLDDVTEADMVAPAESYDPQIEQPLEDTI